MPGIVSDESLSVALQLLEVSFARASGHGRPGPLSVSVLSLSTAVSPLQYNMRSPTNRLRLGPQQQDSKASSDESKPRKRRSLLDSDDEEESDTEKDKPEKTAGEVRESPLVQTSNPRYACLHAHPLST